MSWMAPIPFQGRGRVEAQPPVLEAIHVERHQPRCSNGLHQRVSPEHVPSPSPSSRMVQPICPVASSLPGYPSSSSVRTPPLLYVGMTLRRPDISMRWGISLSLFDDESLVVGDASASVKFMTSFARGTYVSPDPSVVFNPIISQDCFRAALCRMPVAPHYCVPWLLPGDTILSMNGRPISSFDSLASITIYLRSLTHLSMFVIRNNVAMQQSQAILNSKTLQDGVDRAYLAAETSYQIMRGVLRSSSSSMDILHHPKRVSPSQRAPPSIKSQSSTRTLTNLPGRYTSQVRSNTFVPFNPSISPHPYNKEPSITKDFEGWLKCRKRAWRSLRRAHRPVALTGPFLAKSTSYAPPSWISTVASRAGVVKQLPCSYATSQPQWKNPVFRDDKDDHILYSDCKYEFDPEEGTRAKYFLVQVDSMSFPGWLAARKEGWRKKWKTYQFDNDDDSFQFWDEEDLGRTVAHDFWSAQGHVTFEHWLVESTTRWKRSYSWNQRKRRRIEKESEEVVHFPGTYVSQAKAEEMLHKWLRTRKNQWRILRRKRQRQLEVEEAQLLQVPRGGAPVGDTTGLGRVVTGTEKRVRLPAQGSPTSVASKKLYAGSKSSEMLCIDALLEEEEQRQKRVEERPPLDISFIFDARLGAPDDTIAHFLRFLHPSEHWKLLCVSVATNRAMKLRDHMWRQMCPTHWTLPRRPRKPWYELYITRIRVEEETARKRSDDILLKASALLFKGDNLSQIQKLITGGEKRFGFGVDYVSGVVCERNCLLNLAVINGARKTVRWLVESKGADIESCDRGNFTPLLNASWAGDRHLVRFFLSKGANRKKVGTGHYSQPLAPPEFKGLTAEGWARKRGHAEIADLISIGL